MTQTKFWDWDKIMALDIGEVSPCTNVFMVSSPPQVSAARSFVFLWCGSSDGLDLGRLCLQNWGFRRWNCFCDIAIIAMEKYRCEDICWIRTNNKNSGTGILDPRAVLTRFYSLSCS